MNAPLARRECLRLLLGAGGVLLCGLEQGCGSAASQLDLAYAPWDYPGAETRPEVLMAWACLLAANPHNTQPWTLRLTTSRVDLHADVTRNMGSVDPLLRELHIGLGCGLENLVVAARATGHQATVTLLPDPTDPTLVASVRITPGPADGTRLEAIARRHTNRGRYADAPLSAQVEPALQALVTEPGITLRLLTTEADRATFRSGTIDATRAFIDDAEMSRDTNAWYRQSAEEILRERDGVTLAASGNGAATRLLGGLGGRPSDATSNAYWLAATEDVQTTGSAYGILSAPGGTSREDQLNVGRVYQRLHLWAVSQGLAMQPLNQLAEREERERTQGPEPVFTTLLATLVGAPARRAQMLFRIGYPWDAAEPSPRRPLEWVLR